MNEKVSLRDFLKKNHPLIATIGVFGALTALFMRFEKVPFLAFITLMILVLLMWELFDLFPEIEVLFRSSMRLMIFEFLMIALLMAIGWFILDTYIRIYYRPFTFTVFLGLYAVVSVELFEKIRLSERIHKKVRGKPYRLIRSLIVFTLVAITMKLADYSANYIVDLIENFTP